jgi:transcriptional regulator with XRE-family HTH domain
MDDYLPADQTERVLRGETALKVWCERRGRDRGDVAASAGLSPEVLEALEERTLPLDEETTNKLAAALNVPPSWIAREEYE